MTSKWSNWAGNVTARPEEIRDPRDEDDYLAAGMDGVAQKPIQPDVLLDAIRRVLGGEVAAAA